MEVCLGFMGPMTDIRTSCSQDLQVHMRLRETFYNVLQSHINTLLQHQQKTAIHSLCRPSAAVFPPEMKRLIIECRKCEPISSGWSQLGENLH
jgi:hypothetical protein